MNNILNSLLCESQLVGDGIVEISEGIGGITAVVAGIIAGVKGFSALQAFLSSYNIELAFMTKEKQWRYRIVNYIYIFIVLFAFNIICGLLITISGIGLVMHLTMIISVLLLFIISLYSLLRWILEKIEMIRLYRFISSIIVELFIMVKKILKKIIVLIKEKIIGLRVKLLKSEWVKNVCNKLMNYNWISNLIKKISGISDGIGALWKKSAREKNVKKSFNQKEVLCELTFVVFFLLGICINYKWYKSVQDYNIFSSSLLLSVSLYILMFLLIDVKRGPSDARIFYIDNKTGRKKYIFFKDKDNNCIVGEQPLLSKCTEWNLVDFETIREKNMYSINENHVIQIEYDSLNLQFDKSEWNMLEIAEKIKKDLIDKKLDADELKTIKFYIKFPDKKVYYVTYNGGTGYIDFG